MLIDFSALREVSVPSLHGGEKSVEARMLVDGGNRLMTGTLRPGASIGTHTHTGSAEVIYILSGFGRAVCDGAEERLAAGLVHYCPDGSAHCLINDGTEDLTFFAFVAACSR